jgi:pantetheine-phosphate adenylyltransferase
MFDKLIVSVMKNTSKSSMFTAEERMDFIRRATCDLKNIEIDSFSGLLADYTAQKGAVAIVRGLRAMSDFEYEFQMALTNKNLNPNVETIFLTTSLEYLFLSSSIVKEIARFGRDISNFVPPQILNDIQSRLKSNSK